jgi:nitroimidazol reductase NimA-like FMN-containing flavoprotein (pyridoxamine 5'-phosphate oxidase superfamily)
MSDFTPTPQTTARRDDRSSFDRSAAYAILDEGLVAHVGFVVDGGPFVIPMVYGRDEDRLLLHGSVATRLTRTLSQGAPVCVTVTLLDGLVVARSQFHHSMNYRSVVIVGEARRTTDQADAERFLEQVVDQVIPGRAAEARAGNRVEHRQTSVIEVPIDTASVKVRTGPPVDDDEDLAVGGWGGVLPIGVAVGAPEPDQFSDGHAVPPSVARFRRGSGAAR